jgi:hypothetical protein
MYQPELMTEKVYHNLCETPIRNSDSLGIVLGNKLGLEYKRRFASGFSFKTDRESAEIVIPNYANNCAFIIVDKYYGQKAWDVQYVKEGLTSIRAKIELIEDNFFPKGIAGRSRFVYKNRYVLHIGGYKIQNTPYRILKYCIRNCFNSYEKRYETILADLRKNEKESLERYNKLKREYDNKRKAQTELVDKYSKILLTWTDTVYLREKGSNSTRETIKRD